MRRRRITPVRAALVLLVLFGALAVALIGRSPARASGEAAGASTQVALNHFKCYPATEQQRFTHAAPAVRLEDQFFRTFAAVGRVTTLCNPVEKQVGPNVTPIGEPKEQHLICWSISERNKGARRVIAVNQFGDADLTTRAPATLCVPSLKRLEPFANREPINLEGLDHFKCYSIVYTLDTAGRPINRFERIPKLGEIALRDQFGESRPRVRAPNLLCNPVSKQADPDQEPTRVLNVGHLVCFGLSGEDLTLPATVHGRNQFGVGALALKQANALCLPSEKDPIGGGT